MLYKKTDFNLIFYLHLLYFIFIQINDLLFSSCLLLHLYLSILIQNKTDPFSHHTLLLYYQVQVVVTLPNYKILSSPTRYRTISFRLLSSVYENRIRWPLSQISYRYRPLHRSNVSIRH